ncbi:penicillin-binding protein activator [Parvularcula sp. LCG005]|uniref:penicillin-binding protein activator n=1 Tax=Parvularcula sp. LCG005 TaxID=3078805 RepID=UPI002942A0C2|nr:penicillin-binding protein activator [Parvularcula sp. LCG005]WOI53524.1 penicillin-binding protein activator [Parvularcula sp. LCG005]
MIVKTLRRGAQQVALLGLGIAALAACETVEPPVTYPNGDQTRVPMREPVERDEERFATVPQQRRSEVVRVAILLPFSSTSENIDTVSASMLKAAQMVAFESENAKYVLIPKDTGGTAEGALSAAEEAVREGAEIILGPLFSESVDAVASVARPMGIPVIAFSSDSKVAGDGVYLLSFPPEAEISRVTAYAVEQGYARFGLMAPFTEFGDRVAQSFSTEVYQRGGDIIHTERYERAADAMIEPAKRMAAYAVETFTPDYVTPRNMGMNAGYRQDQESRINGDDPYMVSEPETAGSMAMSGGYQAVLLPEQGRLLRALAPLFPYYNVNVREVKLLGLSAWNNPLLTREPALNGGWFAAPDPSLAEGFKRRYEAAYGERPPRLASLAYDAALLTARLSQLPYDRRFSVETIANPNGYLGADGLFRLRADGMVERGLAILEIRPSGITVVDPAPRSFVTAPDQTGY